MPSIGPPPRASTEWMTWRILTAEGRFATRPTLRPVALSGVELGLDVGEIARVMRKFLQGADGLQRGIVLAGLHLREEEDEAVGEVVGMRAEIGGEVVERADGEALGNDGRGDVLCGDLAGALEIVLLRGELRLVEPGLVVPFRVLAHELHHALGVALVPPGLEELRALSGAEGVRGRDRTGAGDPSTRRPRRAASWGGAGADSRCWRSRDRRGPGARRCGSARGRSSGGRPRGRADRRGAGRRARHRRRNRADRRRSRLGLRRW